MIRLILSIAIIIFYAIRWRPSVLGRMRKNGVNKKLMVGEIFILALAIFQLSGLEQFKFSIPISVNYIGLAIALAGAIFASMARLSMGKNYVPATAAAPSKELVSGGLYKIVRHPSYLGTLIAFIGFEIALSSYFIFVTLILLDILVKQINKEEGMLQESHGEEWQKFIKKTPYKLVPFIY